MSADGTNSPEEIISKDELLAKLEEANRHLEADSKAVSSLISQQAQHSRQASISSQLSWNSLSAANQTSHEPDSQEDIWLLWAQIIREWELYSKKKPYMKDQVRRGIPCHFRPIAWQLLANAHDPALREQYAEYLKRGSPCEKAIRRDIARTYPHHEQFKDKDSIGQESLFNVMKAYSLHDREVGYCQGSGFIVGLLLMEMPEEDAFAVLVRLMQDYRLRELFKPSMAELGLCIYQLESLLQDHLSALWKHFQAQGVHTTAYATSWFLTLFTTTFCSAVAARIMDLFISEGLDIIFRLAIAFLQNLETPLLNKDMEGILETIQNTAPKEVDKDPEGLFQRAFGVKINWKKMKKLEREYSANKSRELEEQIEMRRLRTENKLLLQRIEHLESENGMLADHLVQYQVSRAQEAEEMYALKRELAGYRRKMSGSTQPSHSNGEESNSLSGDVKNSTSASNETPAKKESNKKKTLDAVTSDLIQQLQTELVSVRYREAETNSRFRDLQDRVRELEESNKQLAKNPTNEVAALQEELIAVKLREAESNLQLKEVQKRNSDLEASLRRAARSSGGTNLANVMEERDMLGAELRTVRSKLMEMETANQICTAQLTRKDEELVDTKEKLQASLDREKELRTELSEVERRAADIEAKRKEEGMMWRIRETEQSSTIVELRQRIAELECQKQEIVCHSELLTDPNSSVMEKSSTSTTDTPIHSNTRTPTQIPAALMTNSGIKRFWKDLPRSIMTDSIGPLEDLCFVPDDPMITSIYIGDKKIMPASKSNASASTSGGQ